MAKTPSNHRKRWTPAHDAKLNRLLKQNTPTRLIAFKLGRTENSIYSRVSDIGWSLKPVNQSPYTRRKRTE